MRIATLTNYLHKAPAIDVVRVPAHHRWDQFLKTDLWPEKSIFGVGEDIITIFKGAGDTGAGTIFGQLLQHLTKAGKAIRSGPAVPRGY